MHAGLTVSEALQVIGALAVLAAFVAVQRGGIAPKSYLSLVLNLAGSAVLAALAFSLGQWGFVLLEGSWAAVSGHGLWSRLAHGRLR